jgi:methanogenic corrinoid protein MtbC1
MSDQDKILAALTKAVVKFRADDCRDAALKALEFGVDPTFAVMNGLVKGMEKVGALYDTNEYFILEVLLSAEALYAGLKILEPHMNRNTGVPKATLVIGSVQGDSHDIGKNLVKVMFDTAGWEVHDLGCDVPLETFVEKQMEVNADILALSAMMTTTMMGMKKVISMVRAECPDCLIMIGGAPVTRDIAYFFGADGYARSAGRAVSEGLKMIERSGKHKRQY